MCGTYNHILDIVIEKGGEKGGWGVKDFFVCLSFIFKVLSCSNKFVLLVSMIKEKNFAMTIESQVLRITKIHL